MRINAKPLVKFLKSDAAHVVALTWIGMGASYALGVHRGKKITLDEVFEVIEEFPYQIELDFDKKPSADDFKVNKSSILLWIA